MQLNTQGCDIQPQFFLRALAHCMASWSNSLAGFPAAVGGVAAGVSASPAAALGQIGPQRNDFGELRSNAHYMVQNRAKARCVYFEVPK